MNLEIEPNQYVVAVSGGVDSVVLLDLLAKSPGIDLVVAHFDHGIRPDSSADQRFVEELARKYDLDFVSNNGQLGANASEALARKKRYEFLEKVRRDKKATAIITAHHQDDLLETAIINLIRGTGRRGLTALKSNNRVMRPLLNYSKLDIKNYAKANQLDWREDSTNSDPKYLRNQVRHNILPKIDRQKLLEIIKKAESQNAELDNLLGEIVSKNMTRQDFVRHDHATSLEIMAAWLRLYGIMDYDRQILERLVVASKTAQAGSKHDVSRRNYLLVQKDNLELGADGSKN